GADAHRHRGDRSAGADLAGSAGGRPLARNTSGRQHRSPARRRRRGRNPAGRVFQPDDTDDDVILGERLASILSPDRNPVGSSLTINTRTRRVIGIAGEVSLPTLDRDLDRPELYVPLGSGSRTLYLSLRCRSGCPDEATMRARLGALHPVITPRRGSALGVEHQPKPALARASA